jgi:tRNA pseudouridine38-40 synthase
MNKFRLLIAYDGTDSKGWQRQPNESSTVQGTLEKILTQVLDEPIRVVGSGRTDAGVHALGQVAHFSTSKSLESFDLRRSLNRMLPPTIHVRGLWQAPEEFHAQRSAEKKTYLYKIFNAPEPNPFLRRTWHHVHYPLDLQWFRAASQFLEGKHDFISMQSAGTEVLSTVREIFEVKWEEPKSGRITFSITGSGFLKQMVRNIVGTLLFLHRNSEVPEKIKEIMDCRDRRLAAAPAPACGLYLERVIYPQNLDNRCRRL